jgi:hypothetical protein
VDPDELSAGAVLFVFGDRATNRDAGRGREHTIPPESGYIHVPSGRKLLSAYFATLMLAVSAWDLRERGVVALAPTGDLVPDAAKVRFEVLGNEERPSVEGRLLDAARDGRTKRALGSAAGDEGTLLRAITEIRMASHSDPWSAFCRMWRGEAVDAGVLKLKGIPGRRRPKADPGSLSRLDARFERLMEGWLGFKEAEPDLEQAIRADCFAGIETHYSPSTSG